MALSAQDRLRQAQAKWRLIARREFRAAQRAGSGVIPGMYQRRMQLDMLAQAYAAGLRDAAALAEGHETHAAGDDYQTSGDGRFWDAGTIYDQGRVDAAADIRAHASRHAAQSK